MYRWGLWLKGLGLGLKWLDFWQVVGLEAGLDSKWWVFWRVMRLVIEMEIKWLVFWQPGLFVTDWSVFFFLILIVVDLVIGYRFDIHIHTKSKNAWIAEPRTEYSTVDNNSIPLNSRCFTSGSNGHSQQNFKQRFMLIKFQCIRVFETIHAKISCGEFVPVKKKPSKLRRDFAQKTSS